MSNLIRFHQPDRRCPTLAHIGALLANASDAVAKKQIDYADLLLCEAQELLSTYYELEGECNYV